MDSVFCGRLRALAAADRLPDHDGLFSLADSAAAVLETENAPYRPAGADGKPGGLLDFTPPDQERLPLIVVPDLHARAAFMLRLLEWVPPQGFLRGKSCGRSVLEALDARDLRVVCVGDALHAEGRARGRWMRALSEFRLNRADGPAMTEEMREGLSLLSIVMECKRRFPESFHFLKGNHENIMNRHGEGDFPFRKFAEEGEMVRSFMRCVYGDDVLTVIACFERALPIAAAFPQCVISHAEPRRFFSRAEIVDGMRNAEVVAGLTWTENGGAEEGSAARMLAALTGSAASPAPAAARKPPEPQGAAALRAARSARDHDAPPEQAARESPELLGARYIAGHRPVSGDYALRQNGLFVQIHNPQRENAALVYAGRPFDPEKDIHTISET